MVWLERWPPIWIFYSLHNDMHGDDSDFIGFSLGQGNDSSVGPSSLLLPPPAWFPGECDILSIVANLNAIVRALNQGILE
jgi:hypothetical protein